MTGHVTDDKGRVDNDQTLVSCDTSLITMCLHMDEIFMLDVRFMNLNDTKVKVFKEIYVLGV